MKRSMALVMMMASILAFGAAYAADSQSAAAMEKQPANGITYFDLGSPSTCNDPVGPAEGNAAKPFNGITAFDLGNPGSGARGSCAGLVKQTTVSKIYNGITFF